MKKTALTIGSWVLLLFLCSISFGQTTEKIVLPLNYQVDTRIDNMGYWQLMAKLGLVPVQPETKAAPAKYTGSKVYNSRGILVDDSPDVPVTTEMCTQSENSVFVNPNNKMHVLNSNNETPQPSTGSTNGADWYNSFDGGETWNGSKNGAGGNNFGDPAACINMTGRYFVGAISSSYGQEVSYSDDQGATWHSVVAGTGSMSDMCDKNHLWVDNGPTSPFNGYLYNGWMKSNQIQIVFSSTNGTSWSTPVAISQGTNAGSHNQGVNFKTGPNGEAYAAWSVYDSWPSDEKAIGFSKSLDGGTTWSTAVRIINNIKGIRTTGIGKSMRVNSFPVMACDLSNSPYSGNLYIVWPNIGFPGTNTGNDVDVYMIKSTDGGTTWSTPTKVNQDASGAGKKHYFGWITCDQSNGYLAVVYYDDRNLASNKAEAWMSYSTDGGTTWTDMKVSDVSFTPSPIPNMASNYMGDYLGITGYQGKFYPSWTDNRLGYCMTYVSPIDLIIPQGHVYYESNLVNDTTYGNGNGQLDHGETALLDLSLNCQGTAPEDSVWATLSSSSPWVTITDSTEFYGDFAMGESKMILSGYNFHVSDSVPGLIELPFEITAVDKIDSVSVSTFTILTHGPAISILQHTVSDPAGNNNGRLDPGESAIIYIDTKNTGDVVALNTISELSTTNPYVTILDPSYSLGDLQPGQTATAVFHVTVSSAAYIGSAARFHNYAHAQAQFDMKDFTEKIGLIIEDWETANFNKFAWQFTGQAPWTIDPVVKWEKLYSARSGVIDDNDTSGLFLNYNVLYDDSISFHRLDSSQMFQDRLKFFIDGLMVGQWDGRTPWALNAFPVTAGPHTFKWLYVKNASGSTPPDAAWVDFIIFPPEYKLVVTAGNDAAICAGQTYQLNGMGLNYDSIHWTTSGTGSFSNPLILNPVYTPSSGDITAGSVILTLHGYAQNMPDTASSLHLTINPATTATAGPGGEICAGNTFTVTGSTATNYSTILWTTSGDGTFNDASNLNPVYTPGTNDLVNKTSILTLTAESAAQCPSATSSLSLIIHPTPVVDLGPDSTMCADLSISLNATIDSAASYLWTPSNQTTAEIVVDSAGIGIGSRMFHVLVTDIHGCTTTDSVKVTFKVCGGIQEIPGFNFSIYPNPSSGKFTLEMSALKEIRINIRITSSTGENIYSLNNLDVNGKITRQLDLTGMSQGNYLFKLSSGSEKLTRKLIIQK